MTNSLKQLRLSGLAAACMLVLQTGTGLAAPKPGDFDTQPDGRPDGGLSPAELQAFKQALAVDADPRNEKSNLHYLVQIDTIIAENGSAATIPVTSFKPYPKGPDCSVRKSFYLRKNVLKSPLTGCTPLESIGDGATLSFSFDRLSDVTKIALTGALILPIGKPPYDVKGRAGVDRASLGLSEYGFAAFIEADGAYASNTPATGFLRAGLKGDFSFFGGGLDQIVLGSALYFQSDFGLGGSGYGAQFTLTPQAVNRKINGTDSFDRRLAAGERFSDYYFTVNATLDAFHIDNPGTTGLTAGSDYAWLGGSFGIRYFDNRMIETGLELSASVDAFTDLVSGQNAVTFTGGLGFYLDKSKNASIGLKYESGKSRHTLQDTDKLTLIYQLKI